MRPPPLNPGSDLPAYANGQRFLSKNGPQRERYSDPDASWGHRSAISVRKGGGFYGYRIHAAVCVVTGLPLAWEVKTAREHETTAVPSLLDTLRARGFAAQTVAMDKGYDNRAMHGRLRGARCRGDLPASPDAIRQARRSSRADL
jgi:hypothetical protein